MRMSALLIAVALLAGCAGGASNLDEPPQTVSEVALIGPEYRIGPADVLAIEVWQSPELSIEAPVRPDGRISAPLVDDMLASGKTSTELAREIEGALAPYVQQPRVTVRVAGLGNRNRQTVRILGQVKTPAAVPYRAGLRVTDVMTQVEGLSEFADGNAAVLVRNEDGARESYRLRIDDLIRGGDVSADRPLLPGDTIIIPERFL